MALDPTIAFTGKINPADANYPYGSARNVTTQDDGTGTPFIDLLINDNFGWQQALLVEAGLVPTGSPDTATNSQYLDAMKAVFEKVDKRADRVAESGNAAVATVSDFTSGETLDGVISDATKAIMATNGIKVRTQVNNTTSNAGGAEYNVLTLADFNAAYPSDANNPNGIYQFFWGASNQFVCVISVDDIVDIYQFGARQSVDSTTEIQAAIDYAASFGFGFVKSVKIPAGVFYTTGVTVSSYVTMFGEGDMSILSLPADVPAGTYSIVEVNQASANSIVLRDFSIWGDNNNQANSPTVYGLGINTSAPITYSRFENLYIKECQNNAVRVTGAGGADNSRFINCLFRDTKGSAGVYITACDKLSFTGCTFRSGKVGAGHGILAEGAGVQRLTVDGGCRFDDNRGWGFYVSNVFGQINIADFQAINNREGGVYLDRCDSAQVSDGFLADNGDLSTDAQVKIELSNDVKVDVQVMGGTGYGLHLKNSDDCTANVKIYGRSAITQFSAFIDTCDGTELSGTIKDAGGHGVFNDNSSNGLFSQLKLKNIGVVTNDTYSGLVLDNNSDNNTVQLVKTYSNSANKMKYGVWVANAAANDNMVTNNNLGGYVTAGLQDDGTSTVTSAGNKT